MTGKSTILDILAGEVIVDKGTVLVDNEEVMNRKLRVSYMRYDDYLFSNTIKNMFLELNRNTNETRIHFWLKQANAEYFTYNLQKLIVNNGSNLNSEEKNKLKIALNLVKNSNILLFDEPFKYLDSTSVKRIMTNLRYLNKTIVITTNEERDLVYADKVYELDKGNARERKDYHD